MQLPVLVSKGSTDLAELCANTDASHNCTKVSKKILLLKDIFHLDANVTKEYVFGF